MANHGTGKPMGERIMESIPGTEQHRATHGVTGGHAGVTDMKSHLPGTEEHRMHEAGMIDGSSALGGHHTGTHSTEEHHIRTGMEPGHSMGGHHGAGMGTMGTGMGHDTGMGTMGTGMGTGMGGHHGAGMGTMGTGMGAGMGHGTGMGPMGGGTTGTGMGMGTAGQPGYDEHGKETMGHKIKKMIPGTEENKEKKLEQGRI